MSVTLKKKTDYGSDSAESSEQHEDKENSSEEDDISDQSDENKEEKAALSEENKIEIEKDNKLQSLTFVCCALSDYASKDASELSFEKGEMLTVISIRKDGWWEAKNSDDVHGLVPSTFLKVPNHMNKLINETLQSGDSKETHFWSNLRSSFRKARVFNTAIRTLGSIRLPAGYRECMLGTILKEDKSYSVEAFLTPKLSDSGLSFEDIQWEGSPPSLKPVTTVLQKVIQLMAVRDIIPPSAEYEVTGRHVHMCLHDGNKILSNIHSTRASWESRNPKIWMFNSKTLADSLEDAQIFIRSNKSFATVGILFELCVTYKKKESPEISEMSCGWAFMRLLNDSGLPVKSKTKILKVHNSVPFTNYLDSTSASLNSLQKLMNRRKQSRMVISISSPNRSSTQQICYLPFNIIGAVVNIHLMALYRKVAAEELLQRTSFDSADLIHSPFLSNFPRLFDESDLTDFFRSIWADRVKHDKHHDLRTESKKLKAFCKLFMETACLVMNSCNLPAYALGNPASEQERKAKLSGVLRGGKRLLTLSADLEFKPLCARLLSVSIV